MISIQQIILNLWNKIGVILGWPFLWLIDFLGALAGEWNYKEQRKKSWRFCKRMWHSKI